ncbi:hypothetical protein FFLO_01048 [Filobasidium floriforme]|uniref:Uncharacterized protein n=1 Tax=Filobasidium floriforme TaxID=5210 RepID=A0A8K0NV60_9TREE|nr:hypothetical protein FFLO_01048 [Filobasidium floriforme]
MKFLIFNLTFIAIALGIARQMGITIPRPHIPAPCTKEFALIIAAQSVLSFFSSHISRLLTEQPKRYQGDEDGVLDVKLLENKRRQNQGILLFTIGFMSIIILLAHLFCQDGPWTGPPPDDRERYILMCFFGTWGELGFMIVSGGIFEWYAYSDAELQRTLKAHRLDQLQKDNWVEVGQSGPVKETAADWVRSFRIAKDHPEWVDVKSTDGL